MTQSEFKEKTGEVAINIDVNPAFTAFTLLNWQRAKKAAQIIGGNICEEDKRIVILYNREPNRNL